MSRPAPRISWVSEPVQDDINLVFGVMTIVAVFVLTYCIANKTKALNFFRALCK